MTTVVDTSAKETLASLRRFRVSFGGREHAGVLHPPGFGSVVLALLEPEERESRIRGLVTGELVQILDLDGQALVAEQAGPILDEPAAVGTVLSAREQLYLFLLDNGRAFPVCPACEAREEVDLAFYTRTLQLPPPRAVEGHFIATPGIATPALLPAPLIRPDDDRPVLPRRLAARPSTPPRARRIDFLLPSARIGISLAGDAVTGTLGDVELSREIEAWRTWASPRMEQPSERGHYRADHAGFRTMLRLAIALVELRTEEGNLIERTPETVANLWLADVQFLDALYTATHDLAVETPPFGAEPRCTIHCRCGQAYLPVR